MGIESKRQVPAEFKEERIGTVTQIEKRGKWLYISYTTSDSASEKSFALPFDEVPDGLRMGIQIKVTTLDNKLKAVVLV